MPYPAIQSKFSASTTGARPSTSGRCTLLAASVVAIALAASAGAQTAGTYTVSNLLSDGSVPATITDANFINPWGVTNGTFWINAQGTGFDYVVSATNFPP